MGIKDYPKRLRRLGYPRFLSQLYPRGLRPPSTPRMGTKELRSLIPKPIIPEEPEEDQLSMLKQ